MSSSQAKSKTVPGTVIWAAATETGRRPSNQDRFGVTHSGAGTLLVVCDGLGGHRGGEVAADFAVRRLLESAHSSEFHGDLAPLATWLSAEVAEVGRRRPACEGLGTTLAALLVSGSCASFVTAGDSRIYLARGGLCGLLAEPHDLARILVREGVLAESESLSSPVRGRLTSYLGMEDPEVATGTFAVKRGDRFALVTDGVMEAGEARVIEILSGMNPDEAADALVRGQPTQDNATAVVAAINSTEGPCLAS